MKQIIIIILLSLFAHISYAQNSFLTGSVVDDLQQKITVGNAIILNVSDSSIIQGAVFFEGEFSLHDIPQTPFILKITSMGYRNHYQLIQNKTAEKTLTINEVVLATDMLDGIEISANQQLFEQEGNNMIIHVSSTALSNAGSAVDAMRNAPKIDLNRNGQLSILGKGSAVVYLDGQRVASTQILNSLSSREVERIEIIENPSAKYDAEGNGVIHIITKSKNSDGYKIGLTQEAGYGKHFRSFFDASGYLRTGQLMIQANYGLRPQKLGSQFRQSRTLLDDSEYFTDNHYLLENQSLGHNYSVRSTYSWTEKVKVGLHYTGIRSFIDKVGNNSRFASQNEIKQLDIQTGVQGSTNQNSNTAMAYLDFENEKTGHSLQLNFQYTDFNFERDETIDQLVEENITEYQIHRESHNANLIRIYSTQTDFQKKMNAYLKLELGLKGSYITNNSGVDFGETDKNGALSYLPEFSNDFNYLEQISAGYAQIHWSKDITTIIGGLRAEWTVSDGKSDSSEDFEGFTRNYFNLFPSLSIQRKVSDDMSLSAGYNYRINRPVFQDLNPYVLFVDSLVSLRGNPDLLPEYSHAFSGKIDYKTWSLSMNYTFNTNKINQIYRSLDPENPNIISFVKENLDQTELYALTLSKSITSKMYSANVLLTGFYDRHQVTNDASPLDNQRPGYFFQVNQFLNLPWHMKFSSYIRYTSKRVDGVYVDNPISFINLSLSRKFMNDQFSIQVWANDILDKFKFTGDSNFNSMYMTYLSEGDWRFVKLTLNWNLGKLGTSRLNSSKLIDAEMRRINKNQ